MEVSISLAFQGALMFLYMFIFGLYSVLIRTFRDGDHYSFSTSSVTMCTEMFKLLASLALLYRGSSTSSTAAASKQQQQQQQQQHHDNNGDLEAASPVRHPAAVPVWYSELLLFRKYAPFAVPALLYSVFNNLIFLSMLHFDLGTYKILGNIRILYTAMFTVLVLRRQLFARQWAALVLLTAGCVAVEFDPDKTSMQISSVGTLLLLALQYLLATLGSVSNEKLLKAERVDINVGNIYLYVFGIVFNLAFFALSPGTGSDIGTTVQSFLRDITSPQVLILSGVSSAGGLVTSRIVKFLSSIAKSFAMSIDMLALVLISWAFFDTQLTPFFLLGMVLVMVAVTLYNLDVAEVAKKWWGKEAVRSSL